VHPIRPHAVGDSACSDDHYRGAARLHSALKFDRESLMVIVGSFVSIVVPSLAQLADTGPTHQRVERQHPMKQSSPKSGVAWQRGLALLLLSFPVGCAGGEEGHPAAYQYGVTPASTAKSIERCAVPNEGCPCKSPGEILDCGKVVVKVDGYESCYEASRLCAEDATWGPCISDQAIVQLIQ
jgi:hypothetical protein